MSQRRVLIGDTTNSGALSLDLATLVRTRLLIQARSGGGKSYAIRRILEQTHGAIQHLVIDVEGEFATLREKFDYVLAAKDGDAPADPRAAALLAERLLELKASAILDLYELRMPDRILFVRRFLDALVNAPKQLWHPVLVVIDEAHIFCPQQDRSENASAGAVIDLLTRGRKRGFCAVLATQRLSKLHKDAAAECQNKMIGGTTLDVDQRRAADELGIAEKEKRIELRSLAPGEFFAFGPALSNDVVRVKIAPVITRHPKAGARLSYKLPPPSKHIRALLPQLADLPAEVVHRELTQKELQQQLAGTKHTIAQLERQIKTMAEAPAKREPILEPALPKRQLARLMRIATNVNTIMQTRLNYIGPMLRQCSERLAMFTRVCEQLNTEVAVIAAKVQSAPAHKGPIPDGAAIHIPHGFAGGRRGGGKAAELADINRDLNALKWNPPIARFSSNGSEGRILAVIKQYPGSNAQRIGSLAGVSPNLSTFRVAIGKLRKLNLIAGDRGGFQLSDAGQAAAQDMPDRPTGAGAIEHWRRKVGGESAAPRKVFESILAAGSQGRSAAELHTDTGIDPNVSTFRVAIGRLRNLGLITGTRDRFYISEALVQ